MIDVVVPLYNEEENVPELHRRLTAACDLTGESWRITFVDDGSSDSTVPLLIAKSAGDPRYQIIELSRNFGHQAAITAGLQNVEGDAAILLDGDLQDPPELIPELVATWQKGARVVIARRRSRQETGVRRLGFDLFHKFFKYFIDVPIPANTGTFCLLDREALNALNDLPEAHRFFPGLRAWVGFGQTFVEYDRHERFKGSPKLSLRRLFRYAADGVLSFSFKPLRMMTYIGVTVCVMSFLIAMGFFAKRLLGLESAPLGFTTLSCAVFCLGGIQLIGIGILGEYVGRIYEESKRRPLYFTKQPLQEKQALNRRTDKNQAA